MENEVKKELEKEIKKFERSTSVGFFRTIIGVVALMILWVISIGLCTFVVKICWEIIKFVWNLW